MTETRTSQEDAHPGRGLHILVVDDDRAFRIATQTLLEDEGYTVRLAASAEEGLQALEEDRFDLLLSDLVMGRMGGVELLRSVKQRWPDLPAIMVTGFGSVASAVEAMRLGAADYLTKPTNNDELLIKVRKALESRERDRELQYLRDEFRRTYSFEQFTTRSPKMHAVIEQVQRVADTDLTVLIQGESGTGKELVARALHSSGGRRGGPFIAVNCSALPENLFESELFGHEKGSFTGATQMRRGKFEEANRGTIFLDEIGDMPPGIQAKLLRVLQGKTFERVGSNKAQRVDTRVVAATNRDIEAMAAQGDFREDLFYRVNVFPILLPPLRERLEDIPLLVEQMLERHADLTGGRVRHVSPKALSAMMMHQWRGNVRELENLITRAMVTTSGDTIERIDLPSGEAPDAESPGEADAPLQDLPYREYLDTILRHAEERYLLRMLDLCKGNINQVSRKMGVDRKTIYRKLAEYSIDPARFRPT
jgi:two-component system response regulator AtoC